MRKHLVPLLAALVTAAPLVAFAAPPVPVAAPDRPSVPLVQGWWERENRQAELTERYWQLPPREREHYNSIQYQIDRLERRQREEAREGDRPEYRETRERIEELR